jgi:hypothetical protein
MDGQIEICHTFESTLCLITAAPYAPILAPSARCSVVGRAGAAKPRGGASLDELHPPPNTSRPAKAGMIE